MPRRRRFRSRQERRPRCPSRSTLNDTLAQCGLEYSPVPYLGLGAGVGYSLLNGPQVAGMIRGRYRRFLRTWIDRRSVTETTIRIRMSENGNAQTSAAAWRAFMPPPMTSR